MSADMDLYRDGPPIVTSAVPHQTDLEAIVTLLEVAALDLTPTNGATFMFEELFTLANEIGGGEIVLDERDVRIVLPSMRKIVALKGGLYKLAPLG